MKNYVKKVSKSLLFGLAILAIVLLVYLGRKLGLTSSGMASTFTIIACIYGIYLVASGKHLNK